MDVSKEENQDNQETMDSNYGQQIVISNVYGLCAPIPGNPNSNGGKYDWAIKHYPRDNLKLKESFEEEMKKKTLGN
ncbi:hypothetical protein TNCV_4860791, partial [Trichonephila clavipes]